MFSKWWVQTFENVFLIKMNLRLIFVIKWSGLRATTIYRVLQHDFNFFNF